MAKKIQETIVRAAVQLESGALFLGRRHCECIYAAVIAGAPTPVKTNLQGFLTSTGRYVDRYVAGAIAYAAGQTEVQKSKLMSEDVW